MPPPPNQCHQINATTKCHHKMPQGGRRLMHRSLFFQPESSPDLVLADKLTVRDGCFFPLKARISFSKYRRVARNEACQHQAGCPSLYGVPEFLCSLPTLRHQTARAITRVRMGLTTFFTVLAENRGSALYSTGPGTHNKSSDS